VTTEIGIAYEPSADERVVRIVLKRRGRPWLRSFIRSSGPPLRPSGDALLCFGLLPAMELGCRLRVEAPVDHGLLSASHAVQPLVAGWSPGCRPVDLIASPVDSSYPSQRGHGAFYSGGVDSAYTLATHRSELDGIVTVIGCDIPLTDEERVAWLSDTTTRVAAAYGIDPIVIETDLAVRMHPYLGWIEYHGSMLAGLRHLLADRFATMRVAASVDAATMWTIPWGSHPGIDPQLGTAGAPILLDGFVTRPEKIARLLREPVLLEHLRVCFHGGPNCGTCEKCAMTRICLDVLDGMRAIASFPGPPPPLNGKTLHVSDTSVRNDRLTLRQAALRAGGQDRLIAAIDAAVAAFDRRRPSLLERLRVGERLRLARHRMRFALARGEDKETAEERPAAHRG